MSTPIDEGIVSMKFNNGQFLSGIKDTLASLTGLKGALNFDGGKKGLSDLGAAAGKLNFGALGTQIEGVNGKFLALATVGVTALTRIANSAITTGTQLVKSLTIDPIKTGLQEYETNLNAIQTILANTQSKGTDLGDVNGALKELNEYADKTIYNFSEMARNIGTFTAAGVALEPATSAIKGIANLAAVSGSNSQQASTAMYQLSQALSTGSVKLMDWNSVVNAGMGGELFQENLKESARNHGVAVDEIIDKNGSFRDSLQEGWITDEILLESLEKMTGDLTDAQLKQMGYTDEQIPKIQEMAKTAQDAATKVKTVSQLIGTLQEAAGSGWAQTWQLIFGDFEQAKVLFTNVNNVLGGMIGASADARNELLEGWNELGGRTALINAVKFAFEALMSVLTPVKDAFRQIFPATTARELLNITTTVRDFARSLILSSEQAVHVKRIFKGVFAAFDIGWMVVKALADMLGNVFGAIFAGSGGLLEFAGRVGIMVLQFRNALKEGNGITEFFNKISYYLVFAVVKLKQFISALAEMAGNIDFGFLTSALERLKERVEPLGIVGSSISEIWGSLGGAFKKAWDFFSPMASAMSEFFGNVATQIGDALSTIDYGAALDTINTGLFAALTLTITKFLKGDFKGVSEGGGIVQKIKDAVDGVTETFGAMQASLRAGTLQKIAVAIALVTASIVALSFINSADLAKALAAITVMFTQLVIVMAIAEKVGSSKGFLKMPFIAAAMIGLGAAVLILSFAVRNLSGLSWEELGKGLLGMAAAIAVLAASTQLINTKGLARSGPAMIGLAIGVLILSKAVKSFGEMSIEEIAKGLGAMAGSLLIIAGAMALMQTGVLGAAALVIISGALVVLAFALGKMGGMSWEEIAKSLVVLAGALTIIAVAVTAMSGAVLGAAALIVISGALVVLGLALSQMGGMGWEEIGKALTVLAGALLILAVGVTAMSGAIVGAAALVVIAGALAILTPVLLGLGSMSWDEIVRGLTVLAGALAILGIAGAVLTPVIPTLIGLGIALALIGAGLALAGVGVLAFSAGLLGLAAAGAGVAVALAAMGAVIIGLIPAAFKAVGVGLIALATVIATSGPALTRALTVLILSLLQALQLAIPKFLQLMTTIMLGLLRVIDVVAPKIISTLTRVILALVNAIVILVPRFVDAGLKIILGILTGIGNNIGKIVTAATTIVVNFINGIAQNLPRVIQAAVNLILAFVNGLANAIRNNQSRTDAAMRNLATAMIAAFGSAISNVSSIGMDVARGIARGIGNGLSLVTQGARDLARKAINAAKDVLGIKSPSKEFEKIGKFVNKGFAEGLMDSKDSVIKVYEEMEELLKKAMESANADIATQEERLRKLTLARDENTKAIKREEAALAAARKVQKAPDKLDLEGKSTKQRRAARERLAKENQRELDDIAKIEERLRKLNLARDENTLSIDKTKNAIVTANKEVEASGLAYDALTKKLGGARVQLVRLANQYEANNIKLDEANKKLEEAKKIQDDYNTSVSSRFSDLEAINDETTVSSYMMDLQKKIDDTKRFTEALAQLRELGLNDTMYKELVDQGVDALPFVEELLRGEKGAVDALNKLSKTLTVEAGKLGKQAAKELFQAGVDSAQGLVDGLSAKEAQIRAKMESIAAIVTETLRLALKIKSPSRVMMRLGGYAAEGLAKGLDKYSGAVKNSAQDMGNTAIDAIRSSMKDIGSAVIDEVDMRPVISPVLDLSDVRREAGKLGGMIDVPKVKADVSLEHASSIFSDRSNAAKAAAESSAVGENKEYNFHLEQNNYSPKALSATEIYRNTRNQISLAKEALKTP